MNSHDEARRDPLRLEAATVRRGFERAAATYDAAAVLQREIGQRMAERLAIVKLHPAAILDVGCGTGEGLSELSARFPAAHLVGLDFALAMLAVARRRGLQSDSVPGSILWRLLSTKPRAGRQSLVGADARQIPFADGTFDLVWSNLALHWIDDPHAAFAELHRVLRVGGLLMFTAFGPDTLTELRSAFAGVDRATHVGRFVDMHDLGDMLGATGFAEPVMDMEKLTLTYADAKALMRDLKATGERNATAGRPRGLTGRQRWQRVLDALERSRLDGRLPATFEIVYGHAWKPEPRVSADGRSIVRVHRRRP